MGGDYSILSDSVIDETPILTTKVLQKTTIFFFNTRDEYRPVHVSLYMYKETPILNLQFFRSYAYIVPVLIYQTRLILHFQGDFFPTRGVLRLNLVNASAHVAIDR
jgi:hypothetical protein